MENLEQKEELFRFNNYKNTYSSRLQEYLNDFEDNDEESFIDKELKIYNENLESFYKLEKDFNERIIFERLEHYPPLVNTMTTNKKIVKFLQVRLNELDKQLVECDSNDLSDTSITEKIIYLQKLGVIDFLRDKQPFQSSVNSLATILSAVLGEKATSIQPMINPMLSRDVISKNNPLNSLKTVEKVKRQLINIGFNPNETI